MANLKTTKVLVKYLGTDETRVRLEKGGDKQKIKKGDIIEVGILDGVKLARASKNFEVLSFDYKKAPMKAVKKDK